jgi:ribosomal protein S30
LRNKHNEILLEIASGVRQHTPKLKKSNKQNRFPELHHPEDYQLVEFVKNFFCFHYLDFAALPRAFEEQAQ